MSHPTTFEPATEPIRVGESLDNPCTGERGVLVKSPWEGEDHSLVADSTCSRAGRWRASTSTTASTSDWWNAGEDVGVARVWVSDGRRFLQMIETLFGLARDGHTNAKGLPDPHGRCLLSATADR